MFSQGTNIWPVVYVVVMRSDFCYTVDGSVCGRLAWFVKTVLPGTEPRTRASLENPTLKQLQLDRQAHDPSQSCIFPCGTKPAQQLVGNRRGALVV